MAGMDKILIGFLLMGLVVSSGCISEQSVVCNKPYIRVGTDCCLDKNDNKICDNDEVTTTTITPTTMSIGTTSTLISVPTTTTTTLECTLHSDCGNVSYGGYVCDYGNVARIEYRPVCLHGKCLSRSKVEIVDYCKKGKGDDYDKGDDTLCLRGYPKCINRRDIQFFSIPSNAIVLENISYDGFTTGYDDYKFKIDHSVYSEEDEIIGVLLDVEKPDGTVVGSNLTMYDNARLYGMELGMGWEDGRPAIWVREAK